LDGVPLVMSPFKLEPPLLQVEGREGAVNDEDGEGGQATADSGAHVAEEGQETTADTVRTSWACCVVGVVAEPYLCTVSWVSGCLCACRR
jgi:hypothetical protein